MFLEDKLITLNGLDHFGIEISNMEKSKEFYCRILGMKMQAEFGNMTLMKCGQNELALFERNDLGPKSSELVNTPLGRGHWAFKVNNNDFDLAQQQFPQQEIPMHGPIDWGDHKCLYFLDPDGNLLELISYPD